MPLQDVHKRLCARNDRDSNEQHRFRKTLKRVYPRCWLGMPGDSTFDAAHVHRSANNQTVLNGPGMLMCTRLHRLYDKDLFQIHSETGVVEPMPGHDRLPEDLSCYNGTELKLLPEVMNSDYFRDHLRPALRQRYKPRNAGACY